MDFKKFKNVLSEATRDFEKAKIRRTAGVGAGKFSSKSSSLESDPFGMTDLDPVERLEKQKEYRNLLKRSAELFKKFGIIEQGEGLYDAYIKPYVEGTMHFTKQQEEMIVNGLSVWVAAMEELENPQSLLYQGGKSLLSKILFPQNDEEYKTLQRPVMRLLSSVKKYGTLFPVKKTFGKFLGDYPGVISFQGGNYVPSDEPAPPLVSKKEFMDEFKNLINQHNVKNDPNFFQKFNEVVFQAREEESRSRMMDFLKNKVK